MKSTLGVAAGAVLVLVLLGSVFTASANNSVPSPTLVEIDNNQCNVRTSPTTCQGAYGPARTFRANLTAGEFITVFFMYLYGNSQNATLSFYDSLGNPSTLVTSQCSNSTPIACTATGYIQVKYSGMDNIFFTEQNGTTGEMWYHADLWNGRFAGQMSYAGTSSFCSQSCTGSVSLGPVSNATSDSEVIAASAYVGFYNSTPAVWTHSYYYSYQLTDTIPTGGDSILWQADTGLVHSYTYNATTVPTPNIWAGSAILLYWTH